MSAAWRGLLADLQNPSQAVFNDRDTVRRLEDLRELRPRHMDEIGADVQVISLSTPNTQVLDAEPAVPAKGNVAPVRRPDLIGVRRNRIKRLRGRPKEGRAAATRGGETARFFVGTPCPATARDWLKSAAKGKRPSSNRT